MTVAVSSTIMGIAIPSAKNVVDRMRHGIATREVERTLQQARMKSVSANRPMQVRLNCPADGQFRMVERTDIASIDSDPNRCDEVLYPYPSPNDTDPLTPAQDGPGVLLHFSVAVAGSHVQFSPDGTAQELVASGGTLVAQTISTPVTITLTKGTDASTVTINALGKIQIQ